MPEGRTGTNESSDREAEHSPGLSKSKSQSCPKLAWTGSRGGEFLTPGDTEAVTEGPFGKDDGKGILTLAGAEPNGLAYFYHTHFER